MAVQPGTTFPSLLEASEVERLYLLGWTVSTSVLHSSGKSMPPPNVLPFPVG